MKRHLTLPHFLSCLLPAMGLVLMSLPAAVLQGAGPQPQVGPATSPASSGILCAYWREIEGTQIADLTGHVRYPDLPDEQVCLERFETPENQEGNFGTVVRGYVHPPQTGLYRFFIAGNNQCELWLSTDEDPQHKHRIASVAQWSAPRDWTATEAQQSLPIELKAGTGCYIEARHKNGGGDNHLSVAWKLPDGTLEGPIPGARLSPASPVSVASPKVSLPQLPVLAGTHRLQVQVDYLAQTLTVPVLLTLPPDYNPARAYPMMVFLPDTDQESDPDGFLLQGPDRTPSAVPAAAELACIRISPQCPAGRSYDQRVVLKSLCAAVLELSGRYRVDGRHVGLTGNFTGGTAVWRVAMEMPGFFGAVAPVNGYAVKDPQLPQRLDGVRVRIYTDVSEGVATESANRMKALLADCKPAPEVIYLHEQELGKSTAPDYCYAAPEFYKSLLALDPPAPAPVATPNRRWTAWTLIVAAAALLIAIGGLRRLRGNPAAHPTDRK